MADHHQWLAAMFPDPFEFATLALTLNLRCAARSIVSKINEAFAVGGREIVALRYALR